MLLPDGLRSSLQSDPPYLSLWMICSHHLVLVFFFPFFFVFLFFEVRLERKRIRVGRESVVNSELKETCIQTQIGVCGCICKMTVRGLFPDCESEHDPLKVSMVYVNQ